MAGQPKRRAMIEELERRAKDWSEGEDLSTLEYVAIYIEDGGTTQTLANELTKALGWTVHRFSISDYLRRAFGEEAADERLARSRSRASHMLAEDSLAISDAEATTSVDVARNGLRVRARQWAAERWNAQQYGQSKQTNVSISVTSLHLTALQHAGNRVTGGPQLEQISVVEQPQIPAKT